MAERKLLKPSRMSPGDRAALVAPAFTFDASALRQGRARLEKDHGIRTLMLAGAADRHAYFAGTDRRRADELYHWLTHPDVTAVLAIRGGYGCARIYPDLIARLKRHRGLKPKIVAGYSDLTILLNGLHQDLGWVTFHAPVVAGRSIRTPAPLERSTFRRSLFTGEPLGMITHRKMSVLHPGRARGVLVGGCLSIVMSSLGTGYELDTDGKILFLEDVDERPYRIDRMLTQLLQAGKLERVRGIVFGQLVSCEPAETSRDPSRTSAIEAVRLGLAPLLRRRKIPVLMNFPAGHGTPQITFPIGVRVEVNAARANPSVTFLEPGTASLPGDS